MKNFQQKIAPVMTFCVAFTLFSAGGYGVYVHDSKIIKEEEKIMQTDDTAFMGKPIKSGPLAGCVIHRQRVYRDANSDPSTYDLLWVTRCPNSVATEWKSGKVSTSTSLTVD